MGSHKSRPDQIGPYYVAREVDPDGPIRRLLAYEPSKTKAARFVMLHIAPTESSEREHERAMQALAPCLGLDHPAILRTEALLRHEGRTIIAVEHSPGASIAVLSARGARVTGDAALFVALSLAEALEYAELHGSVVHGGITPTSVLLGPDGTVRLSGFGLAEAFNLEPRARTTREDRMQMLALVHDLLAGPGGELDALEASVEREMAEARDAAGVVRALGAVVDRGRGEEHVRTTVSANVSKRSILAPAMPSTPLRTAGKRRRFALPRWISALRTSIPALPKRVLAAPKRTLYAGAGLAAVLAIASIVAIVSASRGREPAAVAPPPSASSAPAPIASAAPASAPAPPPAAPPATAAPTPRARAIGRTQTLLTVQSKTPFASVYLNLARVGPVGSPLPVRCGERFLAIGWPQGRGREPIWIAPGTMVDMPCGEKLELTIEARRLH